MQIRLLAIVFATSLAVLPPGTPTAAAANGPEPDAPAGVGAMSITPTGIPVPSDVTWGPRQEVGANYTWSYGSHLASTSSATKTHLHQVAMTDRVGGSWVDNNGPYLGVNYVRGNASGTTWGTPFRVNAKSQHGDAAAIATSDNHVYVTWYRRLKVINYDPDAPRTLYFRRNTSHGSAASWGGRLALTATSGRVGRPSIAASGLFVYVAWTDSVSGNIELGVSNDRGATWTKSTIGTTTAGGDGFEGGPSVAAAGSNVVVSWIATDVDRSVVARVSTTNGSSWDSPTMLASGSSHFSASSARDTRIGVAWTADDGARFSLWTTGTWADARHVGPPANQTYHYHYGPALAFGVAGQVGIAWGTCWDRCETFDEFTLVDLAWAESQDDGAAWYAAQVVGVGLGSKWRTNDAPSVLWPTADRRIVAWNGYRLGFPSYRMFLRVGSGTN